MIMYYIDATNSRVSRKENEVIFTLAYFEGWGELTIKQTLENAKFDLNVLEAMEELRKRNFAELKLLCRYI